MKKFIIIVVSITLLICSLDFVSLFFRIKKEVQINIKIAEDKYHAYGEEALISYLDDEKNSYYDRTHLAIWTLGKIRSQKALPVLKKYNLDDPEGQSCKRMHHEKLCQYEIHKAVKAIENGTFLSYSFLR